MWFFPGQYLVQCIEKYGVGRVCESRVTTAVSESVKRSEDSYRTLGRIALQEELQNDKALRSESRLLAALRLLLLTDESPLDLFPQLLQLTFGGYGSRVAGAARLLVRRCARAVAVVTTGSNDENELATQLSQHTSEIAEAFRKWSLQFEKRHHAREVGALQTAVALAVALPSSGIVDQLATLLLRGSCSVVGAPYSELEQASVTLDLDIASCSALVNVWETDEEVQLGRCSLADSGWTADFRPRSNALYTSGTATDDAAATAGPLKLHSSPRESDAFLEALLLGWRELQALRLEKLAQKPYPIPVHFIELAWNARSAAVRRHGVALVLQYTQLCRRTSGEFNLPTRMRGLIRRAFCNRVLLARLAADPATQVYLVKILQCLVHIHQLNTTDVKRSGAQYISLAQMRLSMLSTAQELSSERMAMTNRRLLAARVKAEMARNKSLSVDTRDHIESEEFSDREILTYVQELCDYSTGNRSILEMLAMLSRSLPWEKWMFLEANDPSWPFTNEAALLSTQRQVDEAASADPTRDTASSNVLLELDDLLSGGQDERSDAEHTTEAPSDSGSAQLQRRSQPNGDNAQKARRPLADTAMRRALYALASAESVRRLAALTLWLQVLRSVANATPAAMEWIRERPVYGALRERIVIAMNGDRSAAVRVAAAIAFIYMFHIEDTGQLSQLEERPYRYSELAEHLQPFLLSCAPRDAIFFLREGAFGYAKTSPQLARLHIQFCEQLASKYASSPLIVSWLRNGWLLCMETPSAARDVHASLLRCLRSSEAWLALAAAAFSRRFGVELLFIAARDRPDDQDQRRLFSVSMSKLLRGLWEAALNSTLLDVRRECVLAFATVSALADEPFLTQALESLPAIFKRPGLGISSVAKVAYDALSEILDARAAASLMLKHRGRVELAPALRKCAARASTVVIALSGLERLPPYFSPIPEIHDKQALSS